LLAAGKPDEASGVLTNAMENTEDSRCRLLISRAEIYIMQEKYDKAENDLKDALETSESNDEKALVLVQFADLYQSQGEHKKALNTVREFEKIEKFISDETLRNNPFIYKVVGTIFSDYGFYETSVKYFTKAMKYLPEDTSLFFERGYASFKIGKCKECKEDINIWMKHNYEQSKGTRILSNAYTVLGEYDKALKALNEEFPKAKMPRKLGFYNDRATVYALQGNIDAAIKDLETVIKLKSYEYHWEYQKALQLKYLIVEKKKLYNMEIDRNHKR